MLLNLTVLAGILSHMEGNIYSSFLLLVPHQKRPAIRSKYMQLKALPNYRSIHFSPVIDRSGALDKHPIREAV